MTTHDATLDNWFPRSTAGPLAGTLIADFSRVLAGPYATMLLGDLGATVIKIESPAGDETRSWRPPVHDGEATYYLSVNRNKRSIVLDLREPGDLDVAQRIAARADVLVQNFKPDGLTKYGLDEATVRRGNDSVIYVSISGFGDAAGKALPGYDLLVQATSGLMDLTGEPDGDPQRAGVAVTDVMTGLHAANGILAALLHRGRTGQGQHLRLSLLASALSGLVNQSGGHLLTGEVPHRMGNTHPSIYPYEPLPTADGLLVLAVGNDGQFTRLCAALRRPEMATDPRFVTNGERVAHRAALKALLTDALAGRSATDWHAELSGQGIPCAPILDVAGGVALAEQLGLDPIAPGPLPTVRHPVDYSRTPPSYDRPPPALDADGEHVRRWLRET